MFRSFLALSLLSTALFAIGCGDDTSNTTSGGPPAITEAEACAAIATAVCAKIQSCSSVIFNSQYASTADCEAREAARCPPAFSAEGSNTTPADSKDCADALTAVSCDDLFANKLPDGCQPVPGSLANGAPCGRETQCVSNKCITKGELCGVCAEPIALGGACTTGEECATGLTCANKVCTAVAAEGEACNPASCAASLKCVNNVCVVPVGAGATCGGAGSADNCDGLQGLYCNGMKVCQQIKFAAAGEPCGFLNMEIIGCAASGVCRVPMGMTSGTCVAPAADGAACDEMQGPKCMPGALCVNAVCQLNDASTCN